MTDPVIRHNLVLNLEEIAALRYALSFTVNSQGASILQAEPDLYMAMTRLQKELRHSAVIVRIAQGISQADLARKAREDSYNKPGPDQSIT